MALKDLIIHSQLMPPRQQRGVVCRPRLEGRLLQALDYPVTLVHAGTGYGKSTALAAMVRSVQSLFWYTITAPDRDPLRFLGHLICAFESLGAECCEPALAAAEEAGGRATPETLTPLLNGLTSGLQQEALLVLDDYHWVADIPDIAALLERLVDCRPPLLHVIISSRQRPPLQALTRWQVKGQLLSIGRDDLAFTADEIDRLFREQYNYPLYEGQAQALRDETEGWAIALQMIWQSLQSGAADSVEAVLDSLPSSMEALFEYLAQDVLARKPQNVQQFLLRSSVLRELSPAVCDHVLRITDSARLLAELDEDSFFVTRLGEAYRYHHLFHSFLQQHATLTGVDLRALHRRAAECYQHCNDQESAVHHWLAARDYDMAAEMMDSASERLVRDGRLDTMSEWVTALPPAVLERFPSLMHHMGELCRFGSRFDEALAWYEQARERCRVQQDVAGESRALRGQAAVYLDTVRPIKAESLLQEALHLVDGQPYREEHARLLDLMAENMTNRGRSEEASALRYQARDLLEEGPGRGDLDVRVLLRTGRLNEARAILEERAAEERKLSDRFRKPRSHRETLLVLSLIYAFQGRADQAFACAYEGIDLGRRLGSPFVEAVGYMRLGHAWQTSGRQGAFEQALSCYQRATEIGNRLAVPRTRVEALWGLCRLYGMADQLSAAERSAQEGIEIGLAAGDEWIVALIGAMLGASYARAGQAQQAVEWLTRSGNALRDCGDPFGQAVALLWLAAQHHATSAEELDSTLYQLLELVEDHDHPYLLTRATFLGLPDPPSVVPLLFAARKRGIRAAYASALLESLGLEPDLEFYPGYTLRVQTLGGFAIWRGQEPVSADEWHREKARQLLELLLTHRQRFLQREEIAEMLWPQTAAVAAERQFKVALNALQSTLEPQRPPRAPTLFVQRRGSSYGLNPQAPLWLDAQRFELLVQQADDSSDADVAQRLYRQALSLYQGDYLEDNLYDDWCRDERERLRGLYLHTLTAVAGSALACGEAQEAAQHCLQALASDDCFETAYQLLIRAYLQQGNRVEALRVYERCAAILRQELDIDPMPETVALYEEIRHSPQPAPPPPA